MAYNLIDQNGKGRFGLWKQISKEKSDKDGNTISEGGAIFYTGTIDLMEMLQWLNDAPEEMTKISFSIWNNPFHNGEGDEKAKKAPHLNCSITLTKPLRKETEGSNKDISFG